MQEPQIRARLGTTAHFCKWLLLTPLWTPGDVALPADARRPAHVPPPGALIDSFQFNENDQTNDLLILVRFNRAVHFVAQRLRGGLVFTAHTLVHHTTLGLRVTKKKGGKAIYLCLCGHQVMSPYRLIRAQLVNTSSSSLLALQVLEGP